MILLLFFFVFSTGKFDFGSFKFYSHTFDFSIFFCFVLGINAAKRPVTGGVFLRFVFDSSYDRFDKYCCKVTWTGCVMFVNSRGYVPSASGRRIDAWIYPGMFDVKIWDADEEDFGVYRCAIYTGQKTIYTDYNFPLGKICFKLKSE